MEDDDGFLLHEQVPVTMAMSPDGEVYLSMADVMHYLLRIQTSLKKVANSDALQGEVYPAQTAWVLAYNLVEAVITGLRSLLVDPDEPDAN